MNDHEAVCWLVTTFREDIRPFEASFDNHAQTASYRCWGCDGEFVSVYPEWIVPTDETFPHRDSCSYIAALRASGEIIQNHESKT